MIPFSGPELVEQTGMTRFVLEEVSPFIPWIFPPLRCLQLIASKQYHSFGDKHCKNKKLNAFTLGEKAPGAHVF